MFVFVCFFDLYLLLHWYLFFQNIYLYLLYNTSVILVALKNRMSLLQSLLELMCISARRRWHLLHDTWTTWLVDPNHEKHRDSTMWCVCRCLGRSVKIQQCCSRREQRLCWPLIPLKLAERRSIGNTESCWEEWAECVRPGGISIVHPLHQLVPLGHTWTHHVTQNVFSFNMMRRNRFQFYFNVCILIIKKPLIKFYK